MGRRYFPDKIVKWYEENKRSLPWRETKDPYKIWLSEIILQQTRVAQGLPYYLRFVETYPSIKNLAEAPQEEVLRLWQGLGYYTRARNLQKCAQTIVDKHNGKFPTRYNELLGLPGIGEYTAAAIASISFNEPVAVVDGNVFRVLSRVFGINTPINSPEGKKVFTQLANDLIHQADPAEYNQGLMEFGALFCTPKNPRCEECTFKKTCHAYLHALQDQLPVKLKGKPSRKRYFYYFVFDQGDKLVMRKREEKDIWLGLFDFHLVEKSKPIKPEKLLQDENLNGWLSSKNDVKISKLYKHVLTHQTIFSRFIIIKNKKRPLGIKGNHGVYTLKQVNELPKPVLVSRFLSDHYIL
jgi:A/G-specific adenine glycosylase